MAFEATKAISKALAPLVGGVGKELSGYLADQIRFLRWKSAVRILERAKEFCGKKRLDPKAIPIKFIIPFLENASLEDVDRDETLSRMWSALFASAATTYQARHAIYVDILKKLSQNDAEFVASLYKKMRKAESYWDGEDPFDADLSNVNDKQDTIHSFEQHFAERGAKVLADWKSDRQFFGGAHSAVERCFDAPLWRVDIIPLRYDLSAYGKDGFVSSTTAPFRKDSKNLDAVSNLSAFNLMEKVEIVTWYPRRPLRNEPAVRATCSFALLTSLGFDFVVSCGNVDGERSKGARRQRRLTQINKF